jgi:hypothetical protein
MNQMVVDDSQKGHIWLCNPFKDFLQFLHLPPCCDPAAGFLPDADADDPGSLSDSRPVIHSVSHSEIHSVGHAPGHPAWVGGTAEDLSEDDRSEIPQGFPDSRPRRWKISARSRSSNSSSPPPNI